MRTNNNKETIAALWAVAKGEGATKDNHYFIGTMGEIQGHGYLQGNGDYFPQIPKNTIDIVILRGMKKRDVIKEVNFAIEELK